MSALLHLAAAITLAQPPPFDTPAGAAEGRRYYMGHCAHCHGPEGDGAGGGANLTSGDYRHGGAPADLFRTIRDGLPGSEMAGSRLSVDELWKVVAFIRRLAAAGAAEQATGDPKAGQALYAGKGACQQCHAIGGRGGMLGPALDTVGRRRSLPFLRQSLVEPEAHVAAEYRSVSVVTRAGARVTGVRLNEDDYSIQLRDQSENLRSFRKEYLKELLAETRSLMPAYGKVFSPREIEDLVAYLSRRGGP